MRRLLPLVLAIAGLVAYQATHIHTSGTLPTNCTVGDIYLKTGSGAGLYACVTTNTWTGPFGTGAGGVSGPGSSTDNAVVRWDGAGGTVLQDSLITLSDTGALTFPDGVKQTFNPDGTTAGFNVGSQAGDPSTPANGDCWYDSTANELTCRINGSNVALGSGGGGGTGDLLDYQSVVKPSDEMVESSTTIQNDDHLVLAVGTSQTWHFKIHLFLTTENNNEAPDFLGGFTFPSGTTVSFSQTCLSNGATAVGGAMFFASAYRPSSGAANVLCGILSTADTSASPAMIEGTIISGGTSGNVQFQWAQNSSNADGTIVKADSRLEARCVAGC